MTTPQPNDALTLLGDGQDRKGDNRMTVHTYHEDVHDFGLADDCPRCDELADNLLALDDRMLENLMLRVEAGQEPRSHCEAKAMANFREQHEWAARLMSRLGVPAE